MLGLFVTVPVACFRKGFAREFWETEDLPPPSTCYGFLLSLVGETDRRRHVAARVAPGLLGDAAADGRRRRSARSTVLRTLWRVKEKKLVNDVRRVDRDGTPRTFWRVKPSKKGNDVNVRPDFQELLTDVRLAIWLDSSGEAGPGPTLEERVAIALDAPERIDRFGGLSLGESTHMVDEVRRLRPGDGQVAWTFLTADRGRLSLPVWVDHVGSAGTRYATGDLEERRDALAPPPLDRMPVVAPT